jgi:streptogramin lyase
MRSDMDPIRTKAAAFLAVALLFLMAAASPLRAQYSNTVSGVVKSSSGETVAGAFVRVHSVDSGLGFMVVSGAQGRYATPALLPGKYTIEGIGGDYQSELSQPVEVTNGRPAKMDVTLGVARKSTPPRTRLTQAEYAAVMPEAPAKQNVLKRCVSCHDLNGVDTVTLSLLDSRAEWEEDLGAHKYYYMADLPDPLSGDEWKMVVDYMTQNFSGDGHPVRLPREKLDRTDANRHLPRTLLNGAEAKYVAMELTLRKNAFPHDVALDSQGIAWISEHGRNDHDENGVLLKASVGTIGRIDPKTLSYTQIAVPTGKFPSRPSGGRVDAQGILWQTDNSHNARLIAYNTKTGEFKTYDLPAPPGQKDHDESGFGDSSANINTLTFQDGFVWGSGLLSGQIYRLDPSSGGVITYPTPKGRPPYGLAFDKNKMLWYSVEYGDEIDKIDPATGKRTPYKVLTPHADLRHIQSDAEGNVWASAQESDKLIKVDVRTGEVTEYEPPTRLSGIDTVDVDRKHNLIWIGEAQADKLARFDPRTKTFAEFPLPTPGLGIKRITVDPTNPNRVWWCGNSSGRAGYVEVLE